MQPEENFNYQVHIIHSIILGILKDHERSPARFIDILKIISSVFTKNQQEKKTYLYEFFRESILWKDINVWNNAYNYELNKKKEDEANKHGKEKKTIFGMGMKVLSGITKMVKTMSPEQLEQEEMFFKHETLEYLNFFLINLNLDLDLSTEILSYLARENNIQANFYANLADELENQYHSQDMKRLLDKRRGRNAVRQNKWG